MKCTTRYNIPTQHGFMYKEALNIINAFSAANIKSNFIIGGIAVYPKNETDINTMKLICKTFGVIYDTGLTLQEGDTIYRKYKYDKKL